MDQENQEGSKTDPGNNFFRFRGELQKHVWRYLSHSGHRISALSQGSGVSLPTIRKFRDGAFSSYPKLSTLTALLEAMTEDREFDDEQGRLEKFEGPVLDFLKSQSAKIEALSQGINPVLENQFENPLKIVIYFLASTGLGFPREKLEKLLGLVGCGYAADLVHLGFLRDEDDVFQVQSSPQAYVQVNFKKVLQAFSGFISEDNTYFKDDPHRSRQFRVQSLNDEALKKVQIETQRYERRLMEILSDPEHVGGNLVVHFNIWETIVEESD